MSQETRLIAESGGLICGKYRIEGEIGRGGMGIVYRALHVGLERAVALKVVLPELAQNDVVVRRMLDEARCAAQITSAHVVRVMDVGQLESGQPFIVMELVEGEDLARVMERNGIPTLERAVQWLLEASVAIAEAHEKGIVHRDLKPENMFLARSENGDPHVKVLDFGISKRQGRTLRRSVTRPNELMGSPHYMAPEQIRAPLSVDARADIWSLGTILIELTTGRQAFAGDTLASVCASVLESEPEIPEEALARLPAALVLAMRRAVRKEPDERFQSVAELAAALAPFAPSEAGAALDAIARRSRNALPGRSLPKSDCNVAVPAGRLALHAPSRRRTGVAIAVMGALAICFNVWLITRSAFVSAERRDTPASAPATAAAPMPELPRSADTSELGRAEPAEPKALASDPSTPAEHPRPVPSRPAPPRPPGPRAKAPTTTPMAKPSQDPPAAPPNPWDLETFGGRR
jgi:eukaryotic-like serine/threonine-protein kinase